MASSQPSGKLVLEQTRSPIRLGQKITCGGEGCIYTLEGEPKLVAKCYKVVTAVPGDKLEAMLHHPPVDYWTEKDSILFAWPIDTILDDSNRRVGFLMPYIDLNHHFPLFELYNPKDRGKTAPYFTWRHLLRTSANLASVLARLHKEGYVVGDLNESNILVNSEALVTLVDCDSIQISSETGRIFRCSVGKPDYTPPELQGCNFNEIDRQTVHDNFGLAVLIFMLLMEGVHPFAGSNPSYEENIRAGHWPYTYQTLVNPPRYALPIDILPPGVQGLMKRCFIYGHYSPMQRPTALEWYTALWDAQQYLACCKRNKQHWYSNHLNACPWCARAEILGKDPFPTHKQWVADQKRSNAQKQRQIVQSPPPAIPRQPSSRRAAVSRQPKKFSRRAFIWTAGLVVCTGMVAGVGGIINHFQARVRFVYHGHKLQVNAAAWSPDGKRIASASDDQTVQVWNATDGNLIYTHHGDSWLKSSVAWSPDATRLASANYETVQVWDAVDGSHVLTFAGPGQSDDVYAVAWSPDSTRIASASQFGILQVWDATDGSLIYTYDSKSITVNSVAWSPNSKYIALGIDSGDVKVLNAADGSQVFSYHKDSDSVNAVAWSPDSLRLASAWVAGVLVWNALDGSHSIQYQGHADIVNTVAWSPDGRYIVSGSGLTESTPFLSTNSQVDTTVQVWDATP